MGMTDEREPDQVLILAEMEAIRKRLKATPAVPAERIRLAEPLIERVAFMTIQLVNLEREIMEGADGPSSLTEMYSQSEFGKEFARAKPAATLYNTLVKNFQSCWKSLNDLKIEAERNTIEKKKLTQAEKQAKATADLVAEKKKEREALAANKRESKAEPPKKEEPKEGSLHSFLRKKAT